MALWGFWKRWDTPIEVTLAADRRPNGVRVHRCSTLRRRDVAIHWGLRVTSPARTALDMAPRLKPRALTRLVNDGRRGNLLTLDDLTDVARRNPGHPGTRLLGPHLDNKNNPTRSALEDDFEAFCAHYGLPTPLINTIVHGFEADAYFPDEKVIVELDGWEFHKDRETFESDRERDAIMLAHGIVTIRITKARLRADPAREAARLHAILAQRRAA